MKVKYLRLKKEERKAVKSEFLSTAKGEVISKNLKSARICGILCILYSIFLITSYIIKKSSIFDLVSAIAMIIFAIFTFVYANHIILKGVNNYLINKKS